MKKLLGIILILFSELILVTTPVYAIDDYVPEYETYSFSINKVSPTNITADKDVYTDVKAYILSKASVIGLKIDDVEQANYAKIHYSISNDRISIGSLSANSNGTFMDYTLSNGIHDFEITFDVAVKPPEFMQLNIESSPILATFTSFEKLYVSAYLNAYFYKGIPSTSNEIFFFNTSYIQLPDEYQLKLTDQDNQITTASGYEMIWFVKTGSPAPVIVYGTNDTSLTFSSEGATELYVLSGTNSSHEIYISIELEQIIPPDPTEPPKYFINNDSQPSLVLTPGFEPTLQQIITLLENTGQLPEGFTPEDVSINNYLPGIPGTYTLSIGGHAFLVKVLADDEPLLPPLHPVTPTTTDNSWMVWTVVSILALGGIVTIYFFNNKNAKK